MFCSTQLDPAVGSGACAQPALLAAGAEELAEGECPVAAAIFCQSTRGEKPWALQGCVHLGRGFLQSCAWSI